MKHNICNFVGLLTVATLVCGTAPGLAAQSPNPRGAGTDAVARTNSSVSGRAAGSVSRSTVARNTAPAVSGRVSARGALTSRAMLDAANAGRTSRSAVSRSATMARGAITANAARSAATPVGASRGSISRATAVFNDISKIGGGYANCRDAYATCMDQFCANANDTYRRCFCSQRFTEFRDTESALDQAKTLLMQFEDNNLNAVDKTAAEVDAMYSATVGEAAIKKDTSGAAKILDEIGDLLSGKKKATNNSTSGTSMGLISFDISSDVDDIWGEGGGSSIFGDNSAKNLAELEGVDLYNASNKQCSAMIADSCETDAVMQMARSSYNIMIAQDCNAYAKKIDSQKEAVKQTVRTAEKYLREARLEEYRSHNSADVNECISKVKSALLADTACGPNYKRCMDYTGAYINMTTGEPIYSPRLFQLNEVITLAGVDSNADVLRQNVQFDKFLDSKRMFAATALDTCRDIADTVWTEFKRGALIEIAQAQDEKIEEVKMSCVSTMAECYDTQSSALKDFDDTTSQTSGAVAAYASREMCADKVMACASLYGDTTGCKFDGNGKLTSGNNGSNRCGLDALLAFVDTVDTTRISEGCDTALQNYAKDLCTPSSGEIGYPWKCRLLSATDLQTNLTTAAGTYCAVNDKKIKMDTDALVNNIKNDILLELSDMLYSQCETMQGRWFDPTEAAGKTDYESKFYSVVYGTSKPKPGMEGADGLGVCVKNGVKYACEAQDVATGSNGYATYNAANDTCTLSTEWYQQKCESVLGGYWENGTCYTRK